MSASGSSTLCPCTEDLRTETESTLESCECPKDEHDLKVHVETCLFYRNERLIFPHEVETCECGSPPFEAQPCKCCGCLPDQCRCKKAGREAFDEWRKNRPIGAMPAVLEASHPLMQKFQESLRQFLERENAIAEEEILNLRDELRLSKQAYENDLEAIYISDHDTNGQRQLIEEYEAALSKSRQERQEADQRAKQANERYKKAKEKFEQDTVNEREAQEEVEALNALCRQLETWREETESDLTVSQRMSDKMRAEKKKMADEKRQLDMVIYGLSNEVWKLESKLQLFQKQMEIKNNEMEKVNDRVTSYAAELEDLDLDKRRLVSLWNSVLVNISQRDKAYDTVRDDYRTLQDSYRTLVNNLDVTKKVVMEEMNRGKELAMKKDQLQYDMNAAQKMFENEDAKRNGYIEQINELAEAMEMTDRDEQMAKMEQQGMLKMLKSTKKEWDHKTEKKLKLENEILANLQEILLNDKAVEYMANGIKKMRELSRKQEISLMSMENQHAKIMLDIEVHRNRQAKNKLTLEESLAQVKAKEKELDDLQEKYDRKAMKLTQTQRDLDIIQKKYAALKEAFDMKSPQERRVEELEQQIKALRERTETMQHEWLRLQGHVVKLTSQHQKITSDINLINKQIQICDQKSMRIQAELESVLQERVKVDRTLRDLRGQLEVLERTRKDAHQHNGTLQKTNMALTHEYTANLKDAETEIIQLEEDIEAMDKDKMNLQQELDRVTKEALIWQRKGILAVELKKSLQTAKSAVGEIGQMKNEIHRMEVRREQLRRTSEKLAEDLAMLVTRRETAIEKMRATAALEKAQRSSGTTSQSAYHHKLRLARCDVARVTKDLSDAKSYLDGLVKEQERLEAEIAENKAVNAQLEEQVASLLRECREAERQKQHLLERVVRNQRLGKELETAVRRQSLRVRKPKSTVLAEYEQAKALNDMIKAIVEKMNDDFPYMAEKFVTICNTLDIHTPSQSPRLINDGGDCNMCTLEEEEDPSVNIAEKPLCP